MGSVPGKICQQLSQDLETEGSDCFAQPQLRVVMSCHDGYHELS